MCINAFKEQGILSNWHHLNTSKINTMPIKVPRELCNQVSSVFWHLILESSLMEQIMCYTATDYTLYYIILYYIIIIHYIIVELPIRLTDWVLGRIGRFYTSCLFNFGYSLVNWSMKCEKSMKWDDNRRYYTSQPIKNLRLLLLQNLLIF